MRVPVILLILFCFSLPAMAGEPVLLRHRYQGISEWILTYQITTEISSSGNPTEVKVDGREKVVVTPLKNGNLHYRSICERCRVTSEQTITPHQLGVLGEGDRFEVEISPTGQIRRVHSKPPLARDYPFVIGLPAEEITSGQPWKQRSSMEIPDVGMLDVQAELSLAGVSGDRVQLRGIHRMRWKKDRREGKTEYKLVYDRGIGAILRGKLKTVIEGEVKGHRFEQSVFFNWDLRPAGKKQEAEEGW